MGEPTEFTYRAFAHPKCSPDGALVALLVTNGGSSWVEVFEPSTGRLFYTIEEGGPRSVRSGSAWWGPGTLRSMGGPSLNA